MARERIERKVKCIRCGKMVDIWKTSKKGLCVSCIGELAIEGGLKAGKRRKGNALVKKAFSEYAGKSN